MARQFFKEKFKIKKSAGYSELKELFLKQNRKKEADFSLLMSDLLYSGKEINNGINQKLIKNLIQIIKENPIKENKKLPKKKGLLKKLRINKNKKISKELKNNKENLKNV